MIHYTELCQKAKLNLDMSIPADRGELGHILGEISFYEHELGHPLLSSVAVTKSHKQGDGPVAAISAGGALLLPV